MAVLPENMDRLDVEDTAGSLSVIENYIRYMGERIEFSMRNVTRNVTEAGVSSAEMYILLTALQNDLAATKSNLSETQGEVTALQGAVAALEGRTAAVETGLSSLGETVSGIQAAVTALEAAVSDLTARVEALESGGKE